MQILRVINIIILQGRLSIVLGGLTQRLVYLNLKDCRLTEDDLFFLISFRPLAGLREFNLSCNNLQQCDRVVIAALEKMPHITCLSVSFCSLSVESQVWKSMSAIFHIISIFWHMIYSDCRKCSEIVPILSTNPFLKKSAKSKTQNLLANIAPGPVFQYFECLVRAEVSVWNSLWLRYISSLQSPNVWDFNHDYPISWHIIIYYGENNSPFQSFILLHDLRHI